MNEQNKDEVALQQARVVAPIPSQENAFNPLYTFIGVVILGLVVLFVWRNNPAAQTGTSSQIANVVYLDSSAVISAATKQFLDAPKKDGVDPAESGKEFSKRLKNVLNEYTRTGLLVLDSRHVVASPEGHDITGQVAEKLGLTLEK
jgi:hypothetical protein